MEKRFLNLVDKTNPNGCWLWKGKGSNGYGMFSIGSRTDKTRRNVYAYRWYYETSIQQIPEGKELDHLCHNRACVNPEHLEPVTHRENGLRGNTFGAINARKTHCPKGHPYNQENTGYTKHKNSILRYCRACKRERKHISHSTPLLPCVGRRLPQASRVCKQDA